MDTAVDCDESSLAPLMCTSMLKQVWSKKDAISQNNTVVPFYLKKGKSYDPVAEILLVWAAWSQS